MFIIYVIDLSTKIKNVKTSLHIFTKIKHADRKQFWKQKKTFSVISFQKFPIFSICGFSEIAQCFVGAFL